MNRRKKEQKKDKNRHKEVARLLNKYEWETWTMFRTYEDVRIEALHVIIKSMRKECDPISKYDY